MGEPLEPPSPYWADEDVTLFHGKCEDILPSLPENSVDAVVCDPPYDLTSGKKGGSGPASLNEQHPAGRSRITTGGFMGRDWDATGVAFNPDTWRAVMRVMKPGAYLLAFGGSRTWHRMVCAIEDAGFEIRDPIADLTGMDAPGLLWIQGQGYPKNLDVSKAIDKTRRRDYVLAAIDLGLEIPGNNLHDWTKAEHSPGDEWWERFKTHLSAEDWQRVERQVVATGYRIRRESTVQIAGTSVGEYDITAPATDDAVRWEGWGTALKPAWEPVAVARKPLMGTVAQNVLRYGTGALNLAACKVAHASDEDEAEYHRNASGDRGHEDNRTRDMDFGMTAGHASDDGRWPPNLVLGEVAAAELDRQSGVRVSGNRKAGTYGLMGYQGADAAPMPEVVGDTGGSSRFFPVFKYQAKAPAHERPRLEDGTAWPTVKPLDFMRWLVRLVTPPGGTVGDFFIGTGPVAEACLIEGFRFVGTDQDETALRLTLERLSKPIQPVLFGEAS